MASLFLKMSVSLDGYVAPADGSSDCRDVDRRGSVHRDKPADTNRPVIFSTHVSGNAGQHMNGVACPGAVVVAARGKPWVADAVDLDRVVR